MSRIKIFVSHEGPPIRLGALTRALSFLLVLAVLITTGALSQAQSNFTVIHTFTGPDGAYPGSAPTLDRQGNMYGTTMGGGLTGHGVVYELTHVSGSWILHPLYSFAGQSDGSTPYAGVTIGPDGTLFGTTYLDGASGYGTLFNLKPPAHIVCVVALCPWIETTLHSFAGGVMVQLHSAMLFSILRATSTELPPLAEHTVAVRSTRACARAALGT